MTIQPSDCTTVMTIQLYSRTTIQPYKVLLLTYVVKCTAGTLTPRLYLVVQWSVHWAPSRMTQVLVLARERCCALEMCKKKKIPAPLLGLAKSIYYIKYGKSGVECCFFCFSTSAYILETCGIEIVLTITEVEVEPSSPCKVSLSKSGAFSLSGKSSFSHGTLIGLLVVAIATVRRYFLQKLLF